MLLTLQSRLEQAMSGQSIQVDEQVFAEMQARAVPLIDTPNTVLRRLLGLADLDPAESDPRSAPDDPRATESADRSSAAATSAAGMQRAGGRVQRSEPKRRRAAQGTIAPESIYRMPILEVLEERGGRAPKREALDAV